MSSFRELGLTSPLLQTLAALGHETPTPVQLAVIPPALAGKDVRASAETGSGKTAAFLLPILQKKPRPLSILIMSPTRELAAQIAEAVARYSQKGVRACLVTGGLSGQDQLDALRAGAPIIVATPGRLRDLVGQGISLQTVTTLVLDEADRLLSAGFGAELDELLSALPKQRQTLLLSATMPKKVLALSDRLLTAPVLINLDQGAIAEIQQRAIEVDERTRTKLLVHLLGKELSGQALIFVASAAGCETLTASLKKANIAAAAMHGELRQAARKDALQTFKRGFTRVLVATDLAARGLDIARLPVVVNFDLPRSTVDYVHRVGRTGRAGEKGLALSFLTATNAPHFRLIEKRHGLALARERIAGFEPRDTAPVVRDVHGGIKGKKKSKKDRLREALARG